MIVKINLSGATLSLVFLSFFTIARAQQGQKPNIIFILTDDQRWRALGYAGNDVIKTPEMDKLAASGVYFKNAFVTTPICAASRASIFTGLQERVHGYTFDQGTIREIFMTKSYPKLMKQSGYYTGFFGKFGVVYPKPEQLFDVAEVYDRNNKYHDRRGYYYKTLNGDTVHLTRYTGQQALDFISNAPKDKPFCLSLSFSAPHAHDPSKEQYFWQPAVDGRYANTTMPLPVMGDREYFDAQPKFVREGINRIRWTWHFDKPEKYQHSVKGYYRMIGGIDLEIGKIRKRLEEKGLAGNTIIILMGDNGYFLGERQLAGKWLMYEDNLRVPLIIYDPRNLHHRDVTDMALNIDIPSTIFDFAGLPIPQSWQGQSLAGYVKGESPTSRREYFLCEHLWDINFIPPSEGIRMREWKYFRYRHHPHHEELYDLLHDPLEKYNLAGNARFQSTLNNLRKKCDDEISKQKKHRLAIEMAIH